MPPRPSPLCAVVPLAAACASSPTPPPPLELPVPVLPVALQPEVPEALRYEVALGLPACAGEEAASPLSVPVEAEAREDEAGAAFGSYRLLPSSERSAASLVELGAWIQVVAWDPTSAEGALVHEAWGELVVQQGGAAFSFVFDPDSRAAYGDAVCLSTRVLSFAPAGPESRCVVGDAYFESTLRIDGLHGRPVATLPDWAIGPIDGWQDPTLLTECH